MLTEAPQDIAGIATGGSASRLSDTAVRYAETVRKVSRATLERFGVGSGMVHMPELNRKIEAVFFPYHVDGDLVNWKAHGIAEKAFASKKGGKAALFNLDAVKNSDTVYLTEGEWDCLSLYEAGVPQRMVASVPGGAPSIRPKEGQQRNYKWAQEALAAGLSKAKKIVWCGDMDDPGRLLREDMAAVFGPARFFFVEWPEGCKDASDMLRTDGPDAVRELVTEGLLPWPVDGLYRLSEMPEPPPMMTWGTGFLTWGDRVKLAPRTLSVVTGHGGHGKSTFFAQVWFYVVQKYGLVAAMASFETRAKPHYRKLIRQFWSRQPERDIPDDMRREADRLIDEHYRWIIHPDESPSLDWILDRAEVSVVREGARILQIDPWNRLESQRAGRETETEYISRCLRNLHVFAKDMNCHVQIVAHPAKRDARLKDRAPDLEDISGSKAWETMPDQGFTIHRKQFWDQESGRRYEAELFHRKARFEELGYPCTLDIKLNPATWSFEAT